MASPPDDLPGWIEKAQLFHGQKLRINKLRRNTRYPLLDWCKDFEDVFSEKTHEKLPPHHPYNHIIDLKPSFTLKIAKVYPLNPQEMETCKAFVEEHLKTGCIIQSKSPQASPFFFVPKKDSTLCPCQDYRYLNSHTIQNAYPLPLIPELIDDMKGSTLFTKFDI